MSDLNTELLSNIQGGIKKRLNEISKTYTKLNDVFSDSVSLLKEMVGLTTTDKAEGAFLEFLLGVGVLSYFGKLENDCNIAKLVERDYLNMQKLAYKQLNEGLHLEGGLGTASVEIEVDSVDEEGNKIKESKTVVVPQTTDFKFAFVEYIDVITSLIESILNTSKNESDIKVVLESNLLSNIRQISYKEYKNTVFYKNSDIALVSLLGTQPIPDMNQEIINFIRTNHTYNNFISQVLDGILAVYKYTFQDSFGLKPYVGVLLPHGSRLYTIGNNYRLDTIANARNAFAEVANQLIVEKLGLTTISNRQFDIEDIIKGNQKSIKYYPKKILEYMLGRELTSNLASDVYKPHARNKSWEEYEASYVKEQVEHYIVEAIYYSLEKNIDLKVSSIKEYFKSYLTNNSKAFSFKDKEFIKAYEKDKLCIQRELLMSSSMSGKVLNDLKFFQKCLCSAVCAVTYNYTGNSTKSISIRVVDVTNDKLSATLTRSLFSHLSVNDKVTFHDGLVISDGKTIDGTVSLPFDIYEYKHDFNEALSSAEPLFGYKAVEMFINRGVDINWGRILLGEDVKGTPFFAQTGDKDSAPLQAKFVHNMLAGSRAGKGVQTMNLLGSALASKKPIFYLDNKPDMAAMFYNLSRGNMFIVQGGNYGADVRAEFLDDGIAIQGWKEGIAKLDPELKSLFFSSNSYKDDIGNMVYFRAMTLILGILLARSNASANPEVLTRLGGADGIVVVIDEYKSWQLFEQAYFSCGGTFGSRFKEKSILSDAIESLQDKIALEEDKLANLDPSKSTYATTVQKIKTLKKQLSRVITPSTAYATEQMYKLGETLTAWVKGSIAGLKNVEAKVSDIFVISQDLKLPYDINTVTPYVYERKADGAFNTKSEYKLGSSSLTRGIFDIVDHDYFIGANLVKSLAGSTSDPYIKKNYWYYITESTPTFDTSKKLNDDILPSGSVTFKPYLVLNNNKEDDPNNPKMIMGHDEKGNPCEVPDPDYNYVGQCRGRVNEAVAGLWEEVRLKHLSDIAREEAETGVDKHYGELNAGIGFEGLINLIMQSNGLGSFNPEVDLSSSANIANYVAEKMGYSSYKELLYDFSPYGIFSANDVMNAVLYPEVYADKSARLPIHSMAGLLDVEQSIDEEDFDDYVEPVNNFEESLYNNQTEIMQPQQHQSHIETTQQPLSSVEAMRQQMMEDEDDWGDFDTEEEEVEEVPQYTAKNYTEADVESLAYQIFGKFTFNHPEIALKIQNPAIKGVVFENCIASARQVLFGGVM